VSLLASGTIIEHQCPICGAKVTQLRRGRCISCFNKWIERQPIPFGASCRICREKRKIHLQKVELLGRWHYLCHNCANTALTLDPMPKHIEGIRALLMRDRRFANRRFEKEDKREIKRERRIGARRVIHLEFDDLIYDEELFLDYDEPVEGEVTGVYERVNLADLQSYSVELEI
jgi:hypothetical protein